MPYTAQLVAARHGQDLRARSIDGSQQKRRVLACAVLYRSVTPEESRTPDPQIRRLVLYPGELRALVPLRDFQSGTGGNCLPLVSSSSEPAILRVVTNVCAPTPHWDCCHQRQAKLGTRRSAMALTPSWKSSVRRRRVCSADGRRKTGGSGRCASVDEVDRARPRLVPVGLRHTQIDRKILAT